MPLNYLQRVAGAAARTAAPAKPVASGPPRMPGIPSLRANTLSADEHHLPEMDSTWGTSDARLEMPPASQESERAEPTIPTAPPAIVPIAAPSPVSTPERCPADSKTITFESLLRRPAEVIRPPPGLRRATRLDSERTMQSVLPPLQPPAHRANPQAEAEPTPETAARDLRPTPSVATTTVTIKPPQPTSQAAANFQPPSTVVPKPQPAVSMPSSRAEKSEGRIHIGRIEVKVNHRPAVSPQPKTAPPAAPAFNSLAARYLERFLIRP